MEIKKEIISKIEREYFFVVGDIDVDAPYFIDKINKSVEGKDNINYKTNVIGKHTDWNYFNKEKKLLEILIKLVDHLEFNNITHESYSLLEAWGIKEGFGEYTREHCHLPHYISGSVYLNDHPQKLYFPEIKEEVEIKKGRFVLFSSFLKHYTKRNVTNENKYGIVFNFKYNTITDRI